MNKNKLDTCVNLTHIPSGTKIRIDGRSQDKNKKLALNMLRVRLEKLENKNNSNKTNNIRKNQIGGQQDKIRTIRVKDDIVINHKTNKIITYRKYKKGDLSNLR